MKTIFTIAAVLLNLTMLTGAGWSQAYSRIVSPASGECVAGPDVKVKFEAGGITLAPGAYSLHFKLDDEPFHVQYKGNYAHVFRNVEPGTHTARMYVANAQHEALPGTLSTVSFNVAHYDGANMTAPGQPLLTWNLPQGEYLGADGADVTLDFLLTGAALSPGGLQVAYYVDGRRFLIQDNCYVRHIKDLAPGLHRVRIELQDGNGDLLPGAFNSGERVIAVSPYASEPTGGVEADAYWNAPRINSIPGAMTLGGTRTALVMPLTAAQRTEQGTLTINKQGHRVRLDGSVVSEDITPGHSASDTENFATEDGAAVPASAASQFTVRADGASDAETVTDLDKTDVDNVKRGTIVVKKPASEKTETLHEEAAGKGAVGTPGEAAASAKAAPGSETTDQADGATTRPANRRRADGSISKVDLTTPTARLADRPSLRQSAIDTTRTVRMSSAGTSETRTTTGAQNLTSPNQATTTRSASARSAASGKAPAPAASSAATSSRGAGNAATGTDAANPATGAGSDNHRDRRDRTTRDTDRAARRASRDGNVVKPGENAPVNPAVQTQR